MEQIKIYIIWASFLLSLNYMVHGAIHNLPSYNLLESTSPTIHQFQSTDQMYKKHNNNNSVTKEHKEQVVIKNSHNKESSEKKRKSSPKNTPGLNRKLLKKLGLTKVLAPYSHNRKRLAVESRIHSSPDDSHMFIVKLPPNLYYYSSQKVVTDDGEKSSKNIMANTHYGKKVSFPFNSNGKPGLVYHWNLPVIKKILVDKGRFSYKETAIKNQLTDIKHIPTWKKPLENETIEKYFTKLDILNVKQSLKRRSPSYFAPMHAVNKNSFNKYFPGNGRPKGIYVIKKKQKKRLYFNNIFE